jgi:hypothetical protein
MGVCLVCHLQFQDGRVALLEIQCLEHLVCLVFPESQFLAQDPRVSWSLHLESLAVLMAPEKADDCLGICLEAVGVFW